MTPLRACLLHHHKTTDHLEMRRQGGDRCPAHTRVAQRILGLAWLGFQGFPGFIKRAPWARCRASRRGRPRWRARWTGRRSGWAAAAPPRCSACATRSPPGWGPCAGRARGFKLCGRQAWTAEPGSCVPQGIDLECPGQRRDNPERTLRTHLNLNIWACTHLLNSSKLRSAARDQSW